jgi:hypothetical protein
MPIAAELEVAVAAEGDEGGEQHQAEHDPQVEPAEVAGERGQHVIEHGGHVVGGDNPPKDDKQDESRR